jgi:hypothetical protein
MADNGRGIGSHAANGWLTFSLAKHEVPHKADFVPTAPGYGRINPFCGAMDFEIRLKDGSYKK